ncbi:uncharacterized protein F5147DRAFT_787794 [Suillus discolor]|uniref:Ubiquitin-like domain-containing protein n=1 Tax=Suillus discolor TaxID=1912936 RepID=A0A9P7FD06_9AGAM|nr:uncharacterized protein F5147DRAFT_787794 [Suillus discolor]KAG2113793.1 hypothetical protein F5147DRAFT_787794 [Suillus discolor]
MSVNVPSSGNTPFWEKTMAEAKHNPQLLVLKYGQKRVMVRRQRSYNLMLDTACKYFPGIPSDLITLQTNQLDICYGYYVDITAEIWEDVVDLLNVVEVTRAQITLPIPPPLYTQWPVPSPDNQSAPNQVPRQNSSTKNDDKITIKVVFPSGEIRSAKISRTVWVDALLAEASEILGRRPTDIKAVWGGAIMRDDRSIGSYSIEDGDSITLQAGPLCFAKPVIYLHSPSDIDVSVKLSLIPEWSLSVIYPIVPMDEHRQHLEWKVRTHEDGSLTEHNSGLHVSYLFWEAETNLQVFPRSPASKPPPADTFNPITSSLDDTDSIVIPVDRVTVYLDKSLKVLGLHTEARTSFITYWLPSILKHEYIALRFVPQAAYERAASLNISPQPDVVTRVCMLFKGICKEHLANWPNAQMQAENDVAWWAGVVGVDPTRAGDVTLFRVLEWGGVEVLI